jgi:Coenzyme PQQ synthesis protein D (PqqD)
MGQASTAAGENPAVGLTHVPRLHPGSGVVRVGGRLMATSEDAAVHSFEERDGTVSEVAERIVQLVDGCRTVEQIVNVLCEEFEVGREACTADTVAFLRLLAERKVLIF